MAALCFELRMGPAEYWALRGDEFRALVNEMAARQKPVKVVRGG